MIVSGPCRTEGDMSRLLVGLVTLAVTSGCFNSIDGGDVVAEARTVEAFSSVRVDDGLRVTIASGVPGVSVEGPQKALEVLDTVVTREQLLVRLRPGVKVTTTETIRIIVSGDRVSAVEANEAAKVDASGLTGSPVRLTATGGSSIVASGTSDDVRVNASGASFIDAKGIDAAEVSVDASGGSKVDVKATKNVVGTASGGSQVSVTGGADPTRISTSGGSTAQ